MGKHKNKRNRPQNRNSGSGSAEPDSVTAYFLNLKRDWSVEQFKKQEEFFQKNYTGTVYTGNTQRGNRWKKSRGADRDLEREERERLQLLQDYFPFDEE